MGGREGWGEKGELVLSCYQIAITDASRHRRHRSNPRSFCRSHAEGEGDRSPRNRTLPSCRLITPPKSPALRISMDAGTDSDKGTHLRPWLCIHITDHACFRLWTPKAPPSIFFFFFPNNRGNREAFFLLIFSLLLYFWSFLT